MGVTASLHRYWEQRARDYEVADVYGRKVLREFLNKIKPQSLVEVGCGAGELFPLYRGIPRVVGCDWSQTMLERSEQRRKRHEWNNIELRPLNIIKAHTPDRFDVALTRTVLMHIDPERDEEGGLMHVEMAARNLCEMSDQLLLFEYYEQHFRALGPHNWLYNYPRMFGDLGYRLVEAYERQDVPQTLFWFKREAK